MPGGFEMAGRLSRVFGIVLCVCAAFVVFPVAAQEEESILPEGAAPPAEETSPPGDQLLPDEYQPNAPDPDQIPGPTDPVADDDGDGLPNIMDPDDNNNGVVDDDEPRGGPEQPVEDPAPAAPDTSGEAYAPAPVAAGASSVNEKPVALALPNTGSGPAPDAGHAPVVLVGLMMLFACGGVLLRESRHRS